MKIVKGKNVVLDGYIVYCPNCKKYIYIEYDEYNEIEEIMINNTVGNYAKIVTCPHCQRMFGFKDVDDRVYHTELVLEDENEEET